MTERTLTDGIGFMARTDEDILATTVREHARLVYRIAYSVLRNHHDAEDAAQETFVRVLRYKRKLEGVDDPKTWLARIAWRVALERHKRRPEVWLSEEEMNAALETIASQMASAEETALADETSRLLTSLISALPEQLGNALRLATVEELSPAGIAEVLGTTESSVRSRIFRARQILKEKLATLENHYGRKR